MPSFWNIEDVFSKESFYNEQFLGKKKLPYWKEFVSEGNNKTLNPDSLWMKSVKSLHPTTLLEELIPIVGTMGNWKKTGSLVLLSAL